MKYILLFMLLFSSSLKGQNQGLVSVVDILSMRDAPSYQITVALPSFCCFGVCYSNNKLYAPEVDAEITFKKHPIIPVPKVLEWGEINELSLSGSISDKQTKDGIIFGNIHLYEQGELVLGTMSDMNGNFILPKVEPGQYTLRVSYVGYQEYERIIDLGENTILDIDLEQGLILHEVLVTACHPEVVRTMCVTTGTVTSEECFNPVEIRKTEKLETKIEDKSGFSFYPNPAIDQILVDIKKGTGLLTITSASGRLMYKENFPSEGTKRIFLNDFMSGTYFISIISEGEVFSKRLMVVSY